MPRLKTVLHSKYLYIILFILLSIYCICFYNIKRKSNININSNSFIGIITNYKINNDLLTLEIRGNEKIIGYYYFNNTKEINNYKLGDKVKLIGTFKEPTNNTVPNLFNYKNYLKYKKIYLTMNIDTITKISNNKDIIYSIKNLINNHISKYKSKSYLSTFILGDKNNIDKDIIKTYQSNGTSHLLAISGMHVSLLGCLIIFILKKLKVSENNSLIITTLFLLFYMLLTGCSASVERSVLLFSLITINKIFKFDLKLLNLFILTFIIILFNNPYFIFDTGFIYSFTISFYLIYFQNLLKNKSYLKSLFLVSLLSFSVSLPITLYFYYEINFLSIFINIVFVPIVSFIIFPLSLITFFIPILDNLLFIITIIFELLSTYISNITIFKLIFGRESIIFIIIYYTLLTVFLKSKNKKYLILLIILLVIEYNKNFIFNNKLVISIDVNQGDSTLISNSNKNILIDTGGKVSFKKETSTITDTRLIPLFKSLGIRKLDYLILTHGDFDHMGEAINLVNNFKVEKVIFNCGPYNDLEKELIKVLDKKKIKYYSCIKELNIDKNKLYFLQTKEYDNENDNSNVIYTELDGYKFMFMGDASTTTEREILEKYNLPDIDVLKVGHHGSKTSSGKEFIDEINPKYSVISVGKNNRYGHPNKEVLNNLQDSKIYRTDQDGSIMFKIKNNKLTIETCSP